MSSERRSAERVLEAESVRARDDGFEEVFARGSARVFARVTERAIDRFDERISSRDNDLASTSPSRASRR